MGFFKNTKGSLISDYFKLTQDVAHLKSGNMFDVALYDDYLEIKAPIGSAKLKYEQITDVYYGLQTEVESKNKSSIGRAVAGGLLFGGAGAIIGAISGTGKKDVKTKKFVFIISYTSSDGTESFIPFEDTRLYKGAKLAKKLKELAKIEEIVNEYL